MKHSWKLMKGDEIIGVLTDTDVDMPFTVPDDVNFEVITEFIQHIDSDKAWFKS